MRADTAIGHHQGSAIGQQPDFVGSYTMAGQLTDTPAVTAGIVNSNHAAARFVRQAFSLQSNRLPSAVNRPCP